MSSFQCMSCRSQEGQPYLLRCKDYYLQKPAVVDYWQCVKCQLVQQQPLPQDTSAFYENYPIHQKKGAVFNLFRRIVNGGLYFSMKRDRQVQSLLDYGCGDGFFLEQLNSQIQAVGFEPNDEHAKHLSQRLQKPVFSRFEDLQRKHQGQFDVITMHFVLEHVLDMDRTMTECRDLLAPEGLLYIVVPNIFSLEATLFGKLWHNLDAPRHISFPHLETIQDLCQKHGFQLREEKSVPFPNGFAASIPVLLSGKFRFSLYALFLPLGIVFSRLFPSAAKSYLLEKKKRV